MKYLAQLYNWKITKFIPYMYIYIYDSVAHSPVHHNPVCSVLFELYANYCEKMTYEDRVRHRIG